MGNLPQINTHSDQKRLICLIRVICGYSPSGPILNQKVQL